MSGKNSTYSIQLTQAELNKGRRKLDSILTTIFKDLNQELDDIEKEVIVDKINVKLDEN